MATANRPAEKHRTTFSTPSDVEIVSTRVFDAPRQLVWDVHTKPEHVSQWMSGYEGWSMPVCEMDLRPGGKWHYVWRKDGGDESMEMTGEFREVSPPERLVNTEAWGGEFPETLTTTVFTEEDGRTRVTCTVLYPSKEARDRAMETGMEDGWAYSYEQLDEYLPKIA